MDDNAAFPRGLFRLATDEGDVLNYRMDSLACPYGLAVFSGRVAWTADATKKESQSDLITS